MIVRNRRFLVGAILPLMLVALILVWSQVASVGRSPTSSALLANLPPGQSQELTLHSLAFAQSQVNNHLLVPDPGVLGPSFHILGVRINDLPNNVTSQGAGGATASMIEWSVTIFMWNGPFINGSTTNTQILNSGGVAIVESPAPPNAKSLDSAQALLSGGVLCRNSTSTESCTTVPNDGYLVHQGGFAIIVDPIGHQLTWLDDVNHVWVNVVGGVNSVSLLLALAQTIG